MVPNGWRVNTLDKLASVERGKFSARPRNDPQFYGGKIPFVQTGDIAASKTYLTHYSQTLNEAGLKVSRLFPKGTILITIAANIGDTAITTFDVACPDSLVAIQTYSGVSDNYWLHSYLETCKEELDSKATQNAQKNINLQVLKPLEILTPPLPEQQKIASILSTWDKAISTTERLIDNSKQQKKSLMHQLLTGKKRLLDDSGARFDGEWGLNKLGDICQINPKKPSKPLNGKVSFIPMANVSEQGQLLNLEEKQYDEVSKGFTSFIDNDVIIAKITPCFENGKGAFVSGLSNGIGFGSTEFHVLRAKQNICSQFVYYLTRTKELLIKGEMNMQGSAGHRRVTTDYFNAYKIKVPLLKEQQKIASVLTASDKEIDLLEEQLSDLKQEKKALMQQLLTGKRRVKVKDKEVA